jgi:hypothetical protein
MEKIESPCLNCKHQDGCHRTDRFSDCPERLDYLLKSSGHEPHHRGFKPDVPGFEPADPDYIATGPKIIRPYHNRKAKMETDKKSVFDELKEVEELAKNTPPEKSTIHKYELGDYNGYIFEDGSTLPKTKKCAECNIIASDETEIERFFNKHARTKDGYANICKLCHGKKIRTSRMSKKNKPENKKSSKTLATTGLVASSIYRECKICSRFATSEAEIDEIFSKNPLSKDGYHKICKVCHGKNVKKGMKSKKKTKETIVYKEQEDIVNIQTKTCSDCGKVYKGAEVILKNFSPHNTTADGLFKYCKACNKIRLKKSIHKANNENCVMVDFSENMDLLDNLREMAAAAFRSPEQQVLYLISNQRKAN